MWLGVCCFHEPKTPDSPRNPANFELIPVNSSKQGGVKQGATRAAAGEPGRSRRERVGARVILA